MKNTGLFTYIKLEGVTDQHKLGDTSPCLAPINLMQGETMRMPQFINRTNLILFFKESLFFKKVSSAKAKCSALQIAMFTKMAVLLRL